MPKKQLTSQRLRQPSGHFSQATMIEAKGRLVLKVQPAYVEGRTLVGIVTETDILRYAASL